MQNVKLVIFDMDGLMFDTERIAFEAWVAAAEKYGYTIDRLLFEKTIGVSVHKTCDVYSNHFGPQFPIEAILEERLKIAEDIINSQGVPIKKGLLELLDFLKSRSVKLAVGTSTSRCRAHDLLKKAEVFHFFDLIVCGDEVTQTKPHPEIFETVSKKLNCDHKECAVLEDSEAGVEAAYRAGMCPIMIPDQKEPSDYTKSIFFKRFDSLKDAISIFEEALL